MKEKIESIANRIFPEILAIRNHLHANPELSFEEKETAKYISSVLAKYGIEHKCGISGTGIVAQIAGKNPSKFVRALRADLDALPIQEENKKEYCSKNAGVMHACGHDVHSASLLGVAIILNELKSEWEGTYRLIFQPGEEKLPGGASLMIKDGVLENPVPEFIVGQHVFPELETGKVGFRSGMYMASTDELYLKVKGKGGHAALPAQYINPLLVASEIILALHNEFMNEITRNIPEGVPVVFAFGKINGAGATNVIPAEVNLEGTFRTMNENFRTKAHLQMQNIAEEIAAKHNASVEFNIVRGYPFLVNDESLTAKMKTAAIEFLGKENVVDLDIRMTAEDFAWYSQVVPACFYRLGTRNESKGIISPVHTATFDIDENALKTGMGLMAYAMVKI